MCDKKVLKEDIDKVVSDIMSDVAQNPKSKYFYITKYSNRILEIIDKYEKTVE